MSGCGERARNGIGSLLVGRTCGIPRQTCESRICAAGPSKLASQAQSTRARYLVDVRHSKIWTFRRWRCVECDNVTSNLEEHCREISSIVSCADEVPSAVDWRGNGPRRHKSMEDDSIVSGKGARFADAHVLAAFQPHNELFKTGLWAFQARERERIFTQSSSRQSLDCACLLMGGRRGKRGFRKDSVGTCQWRE